MQPGTHFVQQHDAQMHSDDVAAQVPWQVQSQYLEDWPIAGGDGLKELRHGRVRYSWPGVADGVV